MRFLVLGVWFFLFCPGCGSNGTDLDMSSPPFDQRYIYESGMWKSFHAELMKCTDRGEIVLQNENSQTSVLLDGVLSGPHTTREMMAFISDLSGESVYVEQFIGVKNLRPESKLADIWYYDATVAKWVLLNEEILRNGLAKHVESLPRKVSSDLYIQRAKAEEFAKSKKIGIWNSEQDSP